MGWINRQSGRAWLLVVAVAFFPFGAGARDEGLDGGLGESEMADVDADGGLGESEMADVDADGGLGESELPDVSAAGGLRAGIETITVTVQKRSQALQEVPVAASAITSRRLDTAGITQVQDIQVFIPSMHFGQERGEAKITIRGVSNAQGTDQSTAVHTDSIFQNRARSITSFTFFDVERVEVLRGPQGTLYGRNATGGAMNIITVPPRPYFEAFGDFQVDDYHQKMIRGVLNVPVVEGLAAVRLSGFWENRDGYQENFHFKGSYQDADDADDFGIRSQLLWTPLDSLNVTLRFNYARKRGVGYALKRDGPLPETVALVPEFPLLAEQPIYHGATPNPDNERHVYLDAKGDIDNETISWNTDIQWQVPEMPFFGTTKLRVMGSFTDFDDYSVNDQDYSDLPLAVASQWWTGDEWVGEIDWSSDYGEDAGWLLGFFHLGTTGDNTIDAPSKIPIFPDPDDLSNTFNISVPFHQLFESSAYSVAGFVDGWYHITDKLRIEAGVRYSYDWKRSDLVSPTIFVQEEGRPPTPVVLFQGLDDHRTDDWGEPTGSISLDYSITDASHVYGRFAKGYKAGTLNNDIAPIGGARFGDDPDCDSSRDDPDCDGIFSPKDADPENLYALEAGLKNTLFDNRLLLNTTAFVYWYHDLQVSQLFEAQNYVENAADARIFGIEAEFTWLPTDPLTLEAQFSFLDTIYTDYDDCIDAKDFSVQDCTGNELSRAPRFSGSFTATYEFGLGRFGSVTPFAQVYASDDVFFRPTNEPADTQDAYFLLNFRLMWRSEGRRLGLDLFVDNALDKDVATTKIVGSSLLGSPLVNAYDRPRTFGARASIAW